MFRSTAKTTTGTSRPRATAWQALGRLPARSLRSLYLAVFVLFSIFGFYLNVMLPRQLPLIVVFAISLANGGYSMLYPYLLMRHSRRVLLPVGIAHGVLANLMSFAAVHIALHKPAYHLGPSLPLVWTAQCIWVIVFVSYIFFIVFIRHQATDAIRMQNELDLAHGIQQTLVPVVERKGALYEIYGMTRPSDRVGGDLVDVVCTRDGDVAYVADVAGHGLQAGILMGMLKAAAHTALLEPRPSPEQLPQLLHRLDCVLPAVKEQHMYAAFVGLQLGPMGEVRLSLAGHPPVLHYASSSREFRRLGEQQLPLGLLPGAQYADQAATIAPGDLLLVATDGILETCDAEEREFGLSGVQSCVEANASAALSQIATHVLGAVSTWGKQEDDQTLLLVRCLACS